MRNAQLLETLDEEARSEALKRLGREERTWQARRILENLLPAMPQSLGAEFRISGLSGPSSEGVLTGVSVSLVPMKRLLGPDRQAAALGTISKVVEALKAAGWIITEEGRASNYEWSSVRHLNIEVKAKKAIQLQRPRGFRLFQPPTPPPAPIELSMTFTQMPETESCKLVEKEVIVAAVAEHKETRLVVECEEIGV